MTYDPAIDGPPAAVWQSWLTAGAVGVAGALLLLFACGCALRPAGQPGSAHHATHRLAVALAAGSLLFPPALHLTRLLHPANGGAPYWEIEEDFGGPAPGAARWRLVGERGGSWRVRDGRLVVENGPSEVMYLEATFLERDPVPPPWRGLQPAGQAGQPYGERLSWRARVLPAGRFFVLLDAAVAGRELRVQVLPGGVHVTFPDARGVATGHEVPLGAGDGPREHAWALRRHGGAISLEVDGRPIWTATDPGPLTRLRFGETVSDEWHGGRLELAQVRYERRVAAG